MSLKTIASPQSQSRYSIAVFSTAWGPLHGGINSFNQDLCLALAEAGCDVTCVVPRLHAGNVSSQASHVHLLALSADIDTFQSDAPTRSAQELREAKITPDLWIGHDVQTGPIARATRDAAKSASAYAIINHTHYLSYKGIEADSQRADEKHQAQARALSEADVIFAVGPKLRKRASDTVRYLAKKAPAVIELIPGLEEVAHVDAPSQFQLFFAGRLDGSTARLKQTNLAVAAFGRAASFQNVLGSDPLLTLVGASGATEEKDRLNKLAQEHAGRFVNVHALPFTTNKAQLISRLSEHTAAMLLSVHEGFGLTAWEAIATGVPLILSKNSGVYDLLERDIGGPALGCLQAVDIKSSLAPEIPAAADIDTIAAAINHIAREPVKARADARKLRAQLGAYTWPNVAFAILNYLDTKTNLEKTPRDLDLNRRGETSAAQALPTTQKLALFDVYEPSCAPYCVVRTIDDNLKRSGFSRHVWLWGATGTGKTTSVRHAFMAYPMYTYISLSGCIGQSVPQLFGVLLEELGHRLDVRSTVKSTDGLAATLPAIVRAITETTKRPLLIHLDELPIDDAEQHAEFTKAFLSLIVSLSVAAPNCENRIALTSIGKPDIRVTPSLAKAREHLLTHEMEAWLRPDLLTLLRVTEGVLPAALSAEQREAMVDAAEGSPRFIKMCLRKLVLFSGVLDWTFDRVVRETQSEVFQ